MVLWRGITGFRPASDPALPNIELAEFKSACYEAARCVGGRVSAGAAEQAPSSANYHRILLSLPDMAILVLCNAHFPLVAFGKPTDSLAPAFSFIDHPFLARFFEQTGHFRVLPAHELNQLPTPEAIAALAPAEQAQVRYWRPLRVVDIVVNAWNYLCHGRPHVGCGRNRLETVVYPSF